VVIRAVRHDDVDVSRFANSGKVNHADLALIDRSNHSLRTFYNGSLKLCLVEIRDGDCLLCDPAGTNECSRNRKALDDLGFDVLSASSDPALLVHEY
jgi:hypothetical protein